MAANSSLRIKKPCLLSSEALGYSVMQFVKEPWRDFPIRSKSLFTMSKWSVVLALFVSVLMLQGCSTTPGISGGGWPAGIPEQAYYQDSFRADVENQQWQTEQDYMRWVVRFYEGWALYPRGWKWLSEEVDGTLAEEKKPHMSQIMASLGERISAEWSKDRRSRTVNTTHLMIWATP